MRIKYLLFFIIFFISGCFSDYTPYIVDSLFPSSFSFIDIDPNNINQEYVLRMKRYDDIIKKCPIPIFVMSQKDLPIEFFNIKDKVLLGLYNNTFKLNKWPSNFIFLNKDLFATQIMAAFFHEYGHYLHDINNCICFSMDEGIVSSILREKHALLNELEMAYKIKDFILLEESFKNIFAYVLSNNTRDIIYRIAALSAAEGEIWNKALKYLIELKKEKMTIILSHER